MAAVLLETGERMVRKYGVSSTLLNLGTWNFNPRPSTLEPEISTLDPQPWTLKFQPSTLNLGP